MHTDQAQFNDLSADCWSKWAASVVAYPNEGSQDAAYFTLVQLAYQKAPIQTISALESILGQAKHNQRPIDLERFVNCWDDKLNTLIVNQLIDQPEFSRYHARQPVGKPDRAKGGKSRRASPGDFQERCHSLAAFQAA